MFARSRRFAYPLQMGEQTVPEKVQAALAAQLAPGEVPTVVLKTIKKPSATIPILWVAVTNRRLLLFTTLRGSHLFDDVSLAGVNSARREGDALVIFPVANLDPWKLAVDPKFTAQIDDLLSAINARIQQRA